MDASFTINAAPSNSDLATWLGIGVNCLAVAVTAYVAISSTNEARRLRQDAVKQALQVASLGMRQALDLVEMIFQNIEAVPGNTPTNFRWIISASAPAVVAANGVLARDVPDTAFHHLAMQVQTLAHAVDNDARGRAVDQMFPLPSADYLRSLEGLRTSTRELLDALDQERARLKLPRPQMASPPDGIATN